VKPAKNRAGRFSMADASMLTQEDPLGEYGDETFDNVQGKPEKPK